MQRDPGGSPARDPARGRRWPDPARTDREVQVPPAAPPAELHLRAPRFRDRGVDAVRLGEGRSRATAAGRARDQGFCPRVARCAGATAPGSRSSTRKPLTAAARASYGLMSVMAMRSLSTSPSVAVAMARGCCSGTSRAPAGRRVRLAGDPESAAAMPSSCPLAAERSSPRHRAPSALRNSGGTAATSSIGRPSRGCGSTRRWLCRNSRASRWP